MEADNPPARLRAPSESAYDRLGLMASSPAPARSFFLSASSVWLPCRLTLLWLAAGEVPLDARVPADSSVPEPSAAQSRRGGGAASRLPRRSLRTPALCALAGP